MNKEERLMMSKEEARNRAKELLNENQVDLITKYMFLEQQVKKQKEVIEKIKTRYIDYYGTTKEVNDDYVLRNVLKEISDLLKEVE